MNVSRFSFRLVAAFVFFSLAGACGGGGGGSGKPSIKSFTATPNQVSSFGGAVTFSWTVKGATSLSISPDVGMVTGTGGTFTITSGGGYTLSATNEHGTVTKTTVISLGAPIAVSGKIIGSGPLAGVVVAVLNQDLAPVLTDASGQFSFPSVRWPYTIVAASGNAVTVFLGLTRPDPTIQAYLSAPISSSEVVTGTVSGGLTLPLPANNFTYLYSYSPEGISNNGPYYPASGTDGTYSISNYWTGPSPTTAHLRALQLSKDPANGKITGYSGFAAITASLNGSGPLTGQNLTLSAITSSTLTGTVNRPAGFGAVDPSIRTVVQMGAGAAGFPTYYGDVMTLPSFTSTTAAFSLKTPVITGTQIEVNASVYDGSLGYAEATLRGLAPNATNVVVDVPSPPKPLFPLANGVVRDDTVYSSSLPADSATTFYYFPTSGGIYYTVITDGSAFQFPDLSELGMGLKKGQNYSYFEQTYGPFPSVDDAAGPYGFVGSGPTSFTGASAGSILISVAP